ncbi:threonine/homoserine/homoserine lactone efflux protein [Streptomyces sp. SAI-135]|uniref:LysE family translocator n=1 Tax=unclassified Streptomyces TaxID=2593676 RepID=UPI0024767EC9|nr:MULTISPECIES: LysE family translocator [unclassified Streptomyces]MDH6514155.1 threonine/homoserine/homoserine lactone efflux protein [Streptomyces sp. SAI-090]MDH6621765.1 threonine/homoserine/homoserine lactone efflux protein [Streptomyces sp. SAI-135]
MVDSHQLLAFCAMSLLLSAVPGPSVLFVIGRTLAHGRRTALSSVLGNALGGYVLVIAVAMGVGSVVERSVLLFNVIKLAGAAYLVLLGVNALRAAWRDRAITTTATSAAPGGGDGSVRAGFVVGVTNPKSIVFLTAVLPQFVAPEAGHAGVQMLLLGLAGTLLQLVSDSVWGLTASTARAWLGRSPRRMSLIGGTGAVAMIGLGASVAVTGRAD